MSSDYFFSFHIPPPAPNSLPEPGLLYRTTWGAFKNSNAWPHPKSLKSESLGVDPRHEFIKAPQLVSLYSQVESQCSGRIKTSSEVPYHRNMNHQLKMKGHSILSLLSNVCY